MKIIFVSGKYRAKSEWELEQNIRHAQDMSLQLWQEGWAVITPHLNTAHLGGSCHDNTWLQGYLEILKKCDAIFMLDGWQLSEGAREEYTLAQQLNMQIIYENGRQ